MNKILEFKTVRKLNDFIIDLAMKKSKNDKQGFSSGIKKWEAIIKFVEQHPRAAFKTIMTGCCGFCGLHTDCFYCPINHCMPIFNTTHDNVKNVKEFKTACTNVLKYIKDKRKEFNKKKKEK